MTEGAPILDGASGFILLTLSVGIGAYVRQVYVAATEVYDEVNSGQRSQLWPLEKDYTQKRLKNLLYVQKWLRRVTFLMFLFMTLASARLIFSAVNAITSLIPDFVLRPYDLFLVVLISGALLMMWRTHHVGSKRERRYLKQMRRALAVGAEGWIIIFEGDKALVDERHPGAVVHRTYEQAKAAWERGDQVGRPLQIVKINWNDAEAKKPWPP